MKKTIISGLVAAALPFAGQAQEVSIQVVTDKSAAYTLMKSEAPTALKRVLVGYLVEKSKRNRDMFLQFIDTTNGHTVFSRKSGDFVRDGAAKIAMDRTAFNPRGCNDLVAAFDQLKFNIKRSKAEELYIVVFSTLVHSGSPCVEGFDPFAPVPVEIDPTSLLDDKRIKRISFIGATGEQAPGWHQAFDAAAEANGIELEVLGVEEAIQHIKSGEWSWPES